MAIHIFAELLININTLRIQVTLPNVSDPSTQIKLSPGGTELRVEHQKETACLALPVRLVGKEQILPAPVTPSATLHYRFSLNTKATAVDASLSAENIVPWNASELTSEAALYCSSCRSTLVTSGGIATWKDLPTEGWAEMMEFWHCHKPAEPDHMDGLPRKGYSAASRINVQTAVGLIAATSMLFVRSDLQNIEASSHDELQLCCQLCKAVLGRLDAQNDGVRLYKHGLAISRDSKTAARSFDLRRWQACALLTTMESQGVSKITIIAEDSNEKAVSLWVFAPNMRISTTSASVRGPVSVMKVMWKTVDAGEAAVGQELLTGATASVGTLEFTKEEHQLLLEALRQSQTLLPQSLHNFQNWNVSLLPRFTEDDLD